MLQGAVCAQCKKPCYGVVPSSWQGAAAAAGGQCFACYQAKHSSKEFYVLAISNPALVGVDHVEADEHGATGHFELTQLVAHFEVMFLEMARDRGYNVVEDKRVLTALERMADGYVTHISTTDAAEFFETLIPFYWAAAY